MEDLERQMDLLKSFRDIMSASWCSTNAADFRKCFLFVDDYSQWVNRLASFPQHILFNSSLYECATANLFCNLGLYKHAIISLRLCLEHCLFAIQLSTNDLAFRTWKMGNKDMSWAAITDPNIGIFSRQFIQAYAPEFSDRSEELLNIAKNIYRECSEYIHGNYEKLNMMPECHKFDSAMFEKYIELFESSSYLISIALLIRFKDYICSKNFLSGLEGAIMHNIGTLPEVQLLYSENGDI